MSDINVTPRLLRFLEIYRGARLTSIQAKKINEGKIDLIHGLVSLTNYLPTGTNNSLDELTQVLVRSTGGVEYTLTNNPEFKYNLNVFQTITDPSLLNRPSVIHIENLNDFASAFLDAAKFGQEIACVYDRTTSKVILVGKQSSLEVLNQDFVASGSVEGGRWWPR